MNVQKYNAFLKVAEYRSISKAADDMGYTQSAVSKMLQELEKEWDVRLFHRNHDGAEITAQGMELMEDVRSIIQDYEKLNYTVSSLHGLNKGTIRLGAPLSISSNLLPEVLRAFHTEYPNIKVELYEGEDMEISDFLRRGIVDVCVLAKPFSEKYLTFTLVTDSLMAILPPNHPLAKEDYVQIKSFEVEEMIGIREVSDYDINRFLDDHEIDANIIYEVSDDHSMISMIEAGLGVGLDYELMLYPLRYDVVIKPMDATKYRTLDLCVKDEKSKTPLVSLFIDSVKQYVNRRNDIRSAK